MVFTKIESPSLFCSCFLNGVSHNSEKSLVRRTGNFGLDKWYHVFLHLHPIVARFVLFSVAVSMAFMENKTKGVTIAWSKTTEARKYSYCLDGSSLPDLQDTTLEMSRFLAKYVIMRILKSVFLCNLASFILLIHISSYRGTQNVGIKQTF